MNKRDKRYKGARRDKRVSPFGSFVPSVSFVFSQKGQALITLLFFMVMGITITSAAAVILVANIRSASKVEQGTTAYYIAESGAEEGMLQIVRNPLYNGSETISVDGGIATMSATQGNPITILSVGQYNNFIRKVQIQTVYNNGKITIQSWKEVQ